MLMRLDQWVIKRTEPLLQFFERQTGITNFTVARFLLVMMAAVDAVHICQEPLPATHPRHRSSASHCFSKPAWGSN